jgi:hypothetical protein
MARFDELGQHDPLVRLGEQPRLPPPIRSAVRGNKQQPSLDGEEGTVIADVARLRPHTPEGPLKISSEIESAGRRVLVERQPRRKLLMVGARANFQKHREPEELSDRIAPFCARPDRIQSGRQVFGAAEQPESGLDSSSGSVDRVGNS